MENQANQIYENQMNQAESKCANCGADLLPGQAFCANCGASTSKSDVNQQTTQKANTKKFILGAVVGVLVVALAVIMFFVLQKSPEQLAAEGKYSEAYEKAEDSEKNQILAENIIAVLSERSSELMKDPISFKLRNGYYMAWNNSEKGTFGQQAVLYINGTNGFGGVVNNYWVWIYDQDSYEWECWGTCSTTSSDSSDDIDDMLVKIVAESVMEDGIKLDKNQVNNINTKFEDGQLHTIDLIPIFDIDKSLFPTE